MQYLGGILLAALVRVDRGLLLNFFRGSCSDTEKEIFNINLGHSISTGKIGSVLDQFFTILNEPATLSSRDIREIIGISVFNGASGGIYSRLMDMLPEVDRCYFVSQLVYMLYFSALDVHMVETPGHVKCLLVQQIAMHCCEEATVKVLSCLSKASRAQVMLDSLLNYNEGTYNLINILDSPKHPAFKDESLVSLINGYEQNYYSRIRMKQLLERGLSPSEMQVILEGEFNALVDRIFVHLEGLIDETVHKFFKLRGLYAMESPLSKQNERCEGDWIVECFKKERNGTSSVKERDFVQNLTKQMHNFQTRSFEKIVYVLPTIRSLEKSQYIQSILKGHRIMSLGEADIIVFDQCCGEQLEENALFAKRHGIRHYNRDETLELADKVNARHLINCGYDGQSFGYSGGRNAAYLLVGMLVDTKKVSVMQMGDDDMQISVGVLFYDYVRRFSLKATDKELVKMSGRNTLKFPCLPIRDISNMLKGKHPFVPKHIRDDKVGQFIIPGLAGTRLRLFKPDSIRKNLAKPVPFPGEENDLLNQGCLKLWVPTIRHFAGLRLPKTFTIPSRPWVGMEDRIFKDRLTCWRDLLKKVVMRLGEGPFSPHILDSSRLELELKKRLAVFPYTKHLRTYISENPEDRESLLPLYKKYQKLDRHFKVVKKFAQAIVKAEFDIEEIRIAMKITPSSEPFAYDLYLTDRKVTTCMRDAPYPLRDNQEYATSGSASASAAAAVGSSRK